MQSPGEFIMHVLEMGGAAFPDKPAIILVHGLGVSGTYMLPLARLLAPQLRVLVPDLPGFGRSNKSQRILTVPQLTDALAAWMTVNEISDAFLLGNSLGSQVVVDLAVRYPELVAAAVLTGPTVDPQARTALRQIAGLLLDAVREPPRLLFIAARDYFRAGFKRMAITLRHALEDPVEAKLPFVRVPTLVVRGGKDPLVPEAWAEEVARLVPDASLIVIPGAAHAVNFNAAGELAAEVLRFLNGVSPASPRGSRGTVRAFA
jgi:2-hydroxy-6-oxonona-2,4-dienedioate hydrolase